MTPTELKEVLKDHGAWLKDPKKGKKADLTGANLRDANLRGANLSRANLSGANLYDAYLEGANLSRANLSGANLVYTNLTHANLSHANLSHARLSGANLYGANLEGADLYLANLRGANLYGANLSLANLYLANLEYAHLEGANLSGADLDGANLSRANLPDFQLCPQDEPLIGYKKVAGDVVLRLEILGLRTSSLVGRKCRAQKVKVLEAFNLDGTPNLDPEFQSMYDPGFKYTVGEVVEESKYSNDIREECTSGVHFFMTEQEARDY